MENDERQYAQKECMHVVFSVWAVVDCRADDEHTVWASGDREGHGEEQNQMAVRAVLLSDPELKVIFFQLVLHIVELRMCGLALTCTAFKSNTGQTEASVL